MDVNTQSTLPARRFRSGEGQRRDTLEFDMPDSRQSAELFEWWMNVAFEDFVQQVPKMLEYGGDLERQMQDETEEDPEGAIDLQIMGIVMMMMLRWKNAAISVGREISVWFYTLGKICRLVSDYHRQRPGKADTWHDITVYSMMARRIQQVGRWP